jgi:hypothetical protein
MKKLLLSVIFLSAFASIKTASNTATLDEQLASKTEPANEMSCLKSVQKNDDTVTRFNAFVYNAMEKIRLFVTNKKVWTIYLGASSLFAITLAYDTATQSYLDCLFAVQEGKDLKQLESAIFESALTYKDQKANLKVLALITCIMSLLNIIG